MIIDRAVITETYKFNGTMFDCFEYFYRLWELDKEVKLVSKQKLLNKEFLLKKYKVDEECFKNIIIENPGHFKYRKALLFDPIHFSDQILNCDEIFCIRNTHETIRGNVRYFDEYIGYKNYINKIYFQIQRIFEHEDNVFINAMDKNTLSYIKLRRQYPNAIVKDNLSNYQIYSETKGFIPDIFKYFNKYYYIKTSRTYDRHPRMFAECAWQGIECFFISDGNPEQGKDNAYKRFLDRYDFEKRFIFDDEVINLILEP